MTKQELIESLGKFVAKAGAYYLFEVKGTLEIHNIGKAIEWDSEGRIIILEDKYESVFVGCLAYRENFTHAVAEVQAEAMREMREAGF